MWFKRVLISYCATSLVVTAVAAAFNKDATVPKRYHEVERLTFPSLERRQRPMGNLTSSAETTVPTSTHLLPSTSGSQTLTDVATSPTTSFPISIRSSSVPVTQSVSGPSFTSITPSDDSVGVSSTTGTGSTTSTESTESSTSLSSISEQQTSKTSEVVLPSLSQDVTSSTDLGSTLITRSSTEQTQTSGDMGIATSTTLWSTSVSTSASDTVPSSTATPSVPLSLTPESSKGSSSTEATPTLTSDGVSSVLSTASTPPSTSLVPEFSSEVSSTPLLTTHPSTIIVTSTEQSSSAVSSASSDLASFSSLASASQSSPVLSDPESGTLSPVPTSSGSSITTTLSQLSSEPATPTFSSVETSAVTSISIASVSSTSTAAPFPTSPETTISVPTSSYTPTSSFEISTAIPTFSLGTSAASNGATSSEASSSFVPSESLVPSTSSYMTISSDTSEKSSSTGTLPTTQPQSSGSFSATSASEQSLPSGVSTASQSQTTISQVLSVPSLTSSSPSYWPTSSDSSSSPGPGTAISETQSALQSTSILGSLISTSETAGMSADTTALSSAHSPLSTTLTSSSWSSMSSGLTSWSTVDAPLPSSVWSNSTQTTSRPPIVSGTITETFSTVYISSVGSSALDLSGVTFSLYSSVTGAASNQTKTGSSGTTITLQGSGSYVPASESITASSRLTSGANSTWASPLQPSLTAGSSGILNSTRTATAELGITFSRSVLPTGTSLGVAPFTNVTKAETLQTLSTPAALNSTTSSVSAYATAENVSNTQSDTESAMSTYGSNEASTTDGGGSEHAETSTATQAPTNTPSQTAAAGSPPPLTTSETAGVAVGATTGLLIAVVAAIFVARRYHAAKRGRHMSTGSIYPKVAYLYDPKTGGDSGDAEALMSGATGDPGAPRGPLSKVVQSHPNHMQRHSTGTTPFTRFTRPGNPFAESNQDPAVNRYSEYARIDTTRALSAAVAGYGGAAQHSSSHTKFPSNVTNPFNDHVIPSPTFAPFSPDDIKRPELKRPYNPDDGRGGYSQLGVDQYAYLNTAASMYPPVSPYGRPATQTPSSTLDMRRQSIDSDPFADPFEHDLILHVAEQNRTSESVTVFAPSPNLRSPRTPRTPVGPKLPVRQANGLTSARSLLSPVAAKYLHQAQEVKIPNVASPVLVQVGRSSVIKPFSPPPAAPEPLGWDDIKRNSEKHFSDDKQVPAPLKFQSLAIKKKPVATSHTRTKPSLTGTGQAHVAGNGLPLTVKIPHRYNKSAGLEVPRARDGPAAAHEEVSNDPVVREKRSRELRFANPALIGKEF